jgi:hypothetical protein
MSYAGTALLVACAVVAATPRAAAADEITVYTARALATVLAEIGSSSSVPPVTG